MDCWLWKGALTKQGYARTAVRVAGDPELQRDPRSAKRNVSVFVHRLMWALWNGDTTKPLDHICETRACVNPNHLRETTPRDNTLRSRTSPSAVNARRTHCSKGHPLYGDNLYVEPSGRRRCQVCVAARGKAWKEKVNYGHYGKGKRGKRRQGANRTECIRGHPATPENTYYRASGAVECRVCHREGN